MSEINVAEEKYVDLRVKGMTCSNCALSIERYLEREGLGSVNVDFASEEVSFELSQNGELSDIIQGINNLGYKVVGKAGDTEHKGWSRVEILFAVSLIFTLPLLLHMFWKWPLLHNPYFQLVMTIPVFVIGVFHFGVSAFKSLRSGVPNMDVLIILGATAAFGYSFYGTIVQAGQDFLFYETAASIITIVLLGNVMEHRAVQKTTTAIKSLKKLQPSRARKVIYEQGEERIVEVELKHVETGDTIQIHTGDKVPVDGTISEGYAEIDESMLTGESLPVRKSVMDKVMGGTYLIQGNLRIKTSHVGKGTTLSQIIDLVKKAQADKPDLQRLADKISAIFVPVVVGIALLTFTLSFFVFELTLQSSIIHSVAVLVISCPCAMGLATPTAVVVGIGRASRNGILIKGGKTLEELSSIKRIVFDKTGTLTTGSFNVKSLNCLEEDSAFVKRLVYSLSRFSNHPVSRSLNQAYQDVPVLELTEIEELSGRGMEAKDAKGNLYRMGSYQLASDLTEDDTHQTYIIRNDQLLATIDLADDIKDGAKEVVSFLKEQGITTTLLSGDRQDKCDEIARVLGIDEVYAEQMPDQKLALIESFDNQEPTAMVGDGINDAPALTKATVGISLSQATDVAIQSAQIILLNGNLLAIPQLYRIGKHTLLTIKQNLFWAFIYNAIAIPIAAVGLLSPIIGAFAMAMSDVVVIGNSLRLRLKSLK